MYDFYIKRLHLEITSDCNARCPQCSRNFGGTPYTHPLLKIHHWTINDVKNLFSDDRLSKVETAYLCGNYGDIVMHSDALSIIKEIRKNVKILTVHTNGSAKSVEFWKNLAKIDVKIVFALDGLEDTHHLYRRNTRFDVIIKNAKAFIEQGGHATWQFIKYNHNKHQIEECKKIAKKIGFKDFKIINPSVRNSGRLQKISVKDEKFEHLYWLYEESVLPEEKIPSKKEIITKESYDNFTNKIEKVFIDPKNLTNSISCKVKKEQNLFIGADKKVWPCCLISGVADKDISGRQESDLDNFFPKWKLEPEFNDISKFSISKILENLDNFKNIENSWTTKNSCNTCVLHCSINNGFRHKLK